MCIVGAACACCCWRNGRGTCSGWAATRHHLHGRTCSTGRHSRAASCVHTPVLTRISGISGYHVQTVHSARYSVYGRPHAHSRRTRAVSGHVQALRSMQRRLAASRIQQVGCPSKADKRATTAMSMLQRSTAAAQQARTAAPLRRWTDHSHHADQPCAAGAWENSLAAPRQLAAPRRCAAAAWRPWLDGADVHSTESTFTAAILQRLRVF